MSDLLQEIRELVISGHHKQIGSKMRQALDEGRNPTMLLNDVLIDGMRRVGQQFEAGEIFIPEMVLAARAMIKAVEVLRPHLVTDGVKPIGKLAIGTVQGDLHDIGKSLVMMMCEGQGFEIMDLGVNVAPEKFVAAIHEGADLVCMSALLTTTMPNMRTTIQAITQAGLRDRVKIMVGGAPVTQAFADSIGADAYADDASGAARKAVELLGVR